MSVHIAVVADARRGDMAQELVDTVGAHHINVDDGTLGCRGNHLAVWSWHVEHPADWHVVLEDDAVPVENFTGQLDAALAVAPAPILSFYLGGGYINDVRTRVLIDKAQRVGANWLLSEGRVDHAVALVVRADLVGLMTSSLHAMPSRQPIDRSIGLWARRNAHRVAYSVPSLVDHADEQSLVTPHQRRRPRRALSVGQHERWSDKTILMV